MLFAKSNELFSMKTKILFIYLFYFILFYLFISLLMYFLFIYLFIYLFTYLFIYTFCLFLRNLILAKLKEFGDSQNQILGILKTSITQKGIHTWNQIRLRRIRTWRSLLMPCFTSFTIYLRRICNITHKFMIKVKRFSASKKSRAINYK